MWSDNESEYDLLQFRFLAGELERISLTPTLQPTTIGVFGDWGSGKSTLIRMLSERLATSPEVLCIHFNGWLFEGVEDAKSALLGDILDALEGRIDADKSRLKQGWESLKRRVIALRERVNVLQLASLTARYAAPAAIAHFHPGAGIAAAAGVMAADTGNRVLNALKEPDKQKALTEDDLAKLSREASGTHDVARRNVREFRDEFAKLVEGTKIETVVVFIDDLDRCLPDTIIETLEAIRLFLFVPRTVFVIGADERLVEYAVRRRFPELQGTTLEVGRDYLEKLVQIPVRVPPLSPTEIESYMGLLFAQLRVDVDCYGGICDYLGSFAAEGIGRLAFDGEAAKKLVGDVDALKALEGDLDFVAQIAPILAPGMGGNPRRTKRFLNTLLLRLALGEARRLQLRRPILAKLMLLEYLRPEFFRQVAEIQAANEGRIEGIGELERRSSPGGASPSRTDASSGPGAETAQRPDALRVWGEDGWMKEWLRLEPSLDGVDLRPYFYVAHDRLGAQTVSSGRMSRQASEVLERLLSGEDVTQKLGLKQSETLVSADLGAVFQALSERIRRADTLDGSPYDVLRDLVGKRAELVPQFIALTSSIPDSKLKAAAVPAFWRATRGGDHAEAARQVLRKWQASPRSEIASAARSTLATAAKSGS